MSRETKTLAKLAGTALAVLGGFWGMALVAAHLVLDPHTAQARERVQFMCAWALDAQARMYRTDENAYTACVAAAGPQFCKTPAPPQSNPLLDRCDDR